MYPNAVVRYIPVVKKKSREVGVVVFAEFALEGRAGDLDNTDSIRISFIWASMRIHFGQSPVRLPKIFFSIFEYRMKTFTCMPSRDGLMRDF